MTPYYTDPYVTLYHGDCLAIMPTLPDASVDLICVDPPYMNVKAESWDRQWSDRKAYLDWLMQLAEGWQRLLKPNGSLYCFASPQMAAHVEVTLAECFAVLNRIRWVKEEGWHKKTVKEELRSYLSPWEEIIFAEHRHSDSLALGESGYAAQCDQLRGFVFEPIRAYLEGERLRAGIAKASVNAACGFAPIAGAMASRHYFSPSQWCLPTQAHYTAMRSLFNREGRDPAPPFTNYHPAGSPFARWHMPVDEYLRTDYEALRTDYEALRRPFAVTAAVPYTDVWTFRTVPAQPGKHPCEKPGALLRHILTTSTRPDAVVLDCCAGGGSFLREAKALRRKALGIEQEKRWCSAAARELRQEVLPFR